MGADLKITPDIGDVSMDDQGGCAITFIKAPPLSVRELKQLRDAVKDYCKDEGKPEVSSFQKANMAKTQVSELNRYVKDNRASLMLLSEAVQKCCSDNNCKLKAFESGIDLDNGIKSGSGEGAE